MITIDTCIECLAQSPTIHHSSAGEANILLPKKLLPCCAFLLAPVDAAPIELLLRKLWRLVLIAQQLGRRRPRPQAFHSAELISPDTTDAARAWRARHDTHQPAKHERGR